MRSSPSPIRKKGLGWVWAKTGERDEKKKKEQKRQDFIKWVVFKAMVP
jgi:hypothetical protein